MYIKLLYTLALVFTAFYATYDWLSALAIALALFAAIIVTDWKIS